MIRRCGKRYPTEEAALRSKRGLTGACTAVLCRCEGWHLVDIAARQESTRKQRERELRPHKDTGPSRKVRATVLERDQYQCVACGKPVGMPGSWWSIQHRVARGVGGGNVPQNLLTLCGSATSAGCHRRAEDRDPEFHARGYWLRSDEDPALVPVMLFSEGGSGITAWPTADGQWVVEAPAQRRAS